MGGGGATHSSSGRLAGADTVGSVLIPEENVREITGSGPKPEEIKKKTKKGLEWKLSGEATSCWRTRTSGVRGSRCFHSTQEKKKKKKEKNPREQLGLDGVSGRSCLDHGGA